MPGDDLIGEHDLRVIENHHGRADIAIRAAKRGRVLVPERELS